MIKALQRFFLEMASSKTLLVLLVPISRHGSNDPIVALSPLIRRLCRGSADSVFLHQGTSHFSEIQPGRNRLWQQIVLFAHPAFSSDGFAHNSTVIGEESSLTFAWWYRKDHRFEIMVAHVCKGQKILSRPEWREIFPKWISYYVDIHALLMTERDRQIWGEIAKAIVSATSDSKEVREVKDQIQRAYLRKMTELRASGKKRDLVHILHFQKALDGITSNEEN